MWKKVKSASFLSQKTNKHLLIWYTISIPLWQRFQQDNAPRHKAWIISNLYLEHGNGSVVVKRLPSGKTAGVDEIHPEMLKGLDTLNTVGCLADTPLQCCMEVWDSTCRVVGWGGDSHFQKQGPQAEVYSKVPESRFRPTDKPWIQEQHCGLALYLKKRKENGWMDAWSCSASTHHHYWPIC